MKLHDLTPNDGSNKERKRGGRGISAGQERRRSGNQGEARSGQGVHATVKVATSRSIDGSVHARRGVQPINRVEYNEINLDQLVTGFKANAEVTPEALAGLHLLRDPRNPVAVLGRGEIKIR
jgi:large subunit ribosomal protein L15